MMIIGMVRGSGKIEVIRRDCVFGYYLIKISG